MEKSEEKQIVKTTSSQLFNDIHNAFLEAAAGTKDRTPEYAYSHLVGYAQNQSKFSYDLSEDEAEIKKIDSFKIFICQSYYIILSYFLGNILLQYLQEKREKFNQENSFELNSKSASTNQLDIMPKVSEQIINQIFLKASGDTPEVLDKDIEALKQNTLQRTKPIKDNILLLIKNKGFSQEAAIKYHHFDEDRIYSSKFLLEVKNSYLSFIQTGKCRNETFLYVLALFTDFLNNADLNDSEKDCPETKKMIDDKVIDLLYCIAFSQNQDLLLQTFSDSVMNDIFGKIIYHYDVEFERQINIKPSDEQDASEKLFEKAENKKYKCFVPLSSKKVLSILQTFKPNETAKILCELHELTFDYKQAGKTEDFTTNKMCGFIEKFLEGTGKICGKYSGVVYCLSLLMKYLPDSFISEQFSKKDIIYLKEKFDKISAAKLQANENFTPLDLELFKYIHTPESKKQQDEIFNHKIDILKGIFFCQLYSIFASSSGQNKFSFSQEEADFRKESVQIMKDFHSFLLHTNYDDEKKSVEIFCKAFKFLQANDSFTPEINFNISDNSQETAKLVYFLSRYYKDELHSSVDFLNYVREKQLKVLPVKPDLYRTFTKDEAEACEEKLEQNKTDLHKVDPGFNIYANQSASPITLNEPSVIPRTLTIKSFVETDKKFTIKYTAKNTDSPYYKFQKTKEDYRLTNYNHLYNHYLYSDRNVFTHQSASYMIIQNLLDDDNAQNLVYALYDIKIFLGKIEHEINEYNGKNSDRKFLRSGIILFKNEFDEITKKLWNAIIHNPCKDPFKEIFEKKETSPASTIASKTASKSDLTNASNTESKPEAASGSSLVSEIQPEFQIKKEYIQRLKTLDYYHELGPSFLEHLGEFLSHIYNTDSFLTFLPDKIFYYLTYQTFKLNEFKEEQ